MLIHYTLLFYSNDKVIKHSHFGVDFGLFTFKYFVQVVNHEKAIGFWQVTQEAIDYFVILSNFVHVLWKRIVVRNTLLNLVLVLFEILEFTLEKVS